MVYFSKRRGFHDFIKSRNNILYIVMALAFFSLIFVVILVTRQMLNPEPQEHSTTVAEESSAQESPTDEEETVLDAIGKYKIQINLANHSIQVYAFNEEILDYESSPVRTFLCGINDRITENPEIIAGSNSYRKQWTNYTYIIPPVLEELTEPAKEKESTPEPSECFTRYWVQFTDELIFHTAFYAESNKRNTLIPQSYDLIGTTNSEAGITLMYADARWIYENCSFNSIISVINNPEEVTENYASQHIHIPQEYTYDPTEKGSDSPWCPKEITVFDCPKQITNTGRISFAELIAKIKVKDSDGGSLTEYMTAGFKGYYNLNKPGIYTIVYHIADVYGNYYAGDIPIIILNDGTMETETSDETETTAEDNTDEEDTGDDETGENSTSENTTEDLTEEESTAKDETDPDPSQEETSQTPALPTEASEENTEETNPIAENL